MFEPMWEILLDLLMSNAPCVLILTLLMCQCGSCLSLGPASQFTRELDSKRQVYVQCSPSRRNPESWRWQGRWAW